MFFRKLRLANELAWSGILSTVLVAAFTAIFYNSLQYVGPNEYSDGRVSHILAVCIAFFVWLCIYLKGMISINKKKTEDFKDHAIADKHVNIRYKNSKRKIKDKEISSLENEVDEIMAVYSSRFANILPTMTFAYLGHVVSVILLGTCFTYAIINTTMTPSADIKDLFMRKLFTISGEFSQIQTTKNISKEFKENLAKKGVYITENAKIVRDKERDFEIIRDEKEEYILIREENGRLGIYSKNNFLCHIYYNIVTLFTIGFGDIHPVSELGQIGVIIQCLSVLLIFYYGLNFMLSFEQKRKLETREAILTELEEI